MDPWFWADVDKSNDAVQNAFNFSIRQLLLQAYCAFNAFDGDTVYIIFICGVYFSLFRFTRPGYLLPFPEEEMVEAGPSSKKRRLDDQHEEHQHEENQHEEHRHEEHHNVLKKFKRATDIKNPQLSQMLPLNCVEVVYHGVPVFEDIRAPKVHLSDGFRQALRDCLAGIDLQPCSLFELQTVQFSQGEKVRSPGDLPLFVLTHRHRREARGSEPSLLGTTQQMESIRLPLVGPTRKVFTTRAARSFINEPERLSQDRRLGRNLFSREGNLISSLGGCLQDKRRLIPISQLMARTWNGTRRVKPGRRIGARAKPRRG